MNKSVIDYLIKFWIINDIFKGTCTNNWLYTTEVLKYYVHPNDTATNSNEDILDQTIYFKNATLGPWLFCWLDRS